MLAACPGTAAAPATMAKPDRSWLRALERGLYPIAAAQFDTAQGGRHLPQADGRPSAGLDFHICHLGGAGQVPPLLCRTWLGRPGFRLLAKPLRLRRAGRA